MLWICNKEATFLQYHEMLRCPFAPPKESQTTITHFMSKTSECDQTFMKMLGFDNLLSNKQGKSR